MSDTAEKSAPAETKGGKKGLVTTIIIAVVAIAAGAGGALMFMPSEPGEPKPIPTVFKELDTFTVNLQPDEKNQYLQLGLTAKIHETGVDVEIDKKMPEIRNRILLLLTSKTAEEISTMMGKKQLGDELTEEIRSSMDSDEFREAIVEVLFTSFVIQ